MSPVTTERLGHDFSSHKGFRDFTSLPETQRPLLVFPSIGINVMYRRQWGFWVSWLSCELLASSVYKSQAFGPCHSEKLNWQQKSNKTSVTVSDENH